MKKLTTNISNKGIYLSIGNSNSEVNVNGAYIVAWGGYAMVVKGCEVQDSEELTFNFSPSFAY